MSKALNWLSLLIGIWLIISPWVLHFSDNPGAMWNNVIFGIIVGIIGLILALGGKSSEGTPTS